MIKCVIIVDILEMRLIRVIQLYKIIVQFQSLIIHFQIQRKIRSMNLLQFIEKNQSILQKYIFAQNKQKYLESLDAVSQDKKFFKVLLGSLDDREKQVYSELGLDSNAREQLYKAKMLKQIRQAKTQSQKNSAMKYIRQICGNQYFDYQEPIEIKHQNNIIANEETSEKKATKHVFQSEATVKEVVLKALKLDKNNIYKLSPYGLKNLPFEKVKEMDQNMIQHFFQNKELLKSLNPEHLAQLLEKIIKKVSQMKLTSQEEQFPVQFYQTLSNQQIQCLKLRMPNIFKSIQYISLQFRQKYQEKLIKYKPINQLSLSQRQQKKHLCSTIVQSLKEQNNQFYDYFITRLTEQILLINAFDSNSDLQFFVDYLKSLKSISYEHLETQFKKKITQAYGKDKYINQRYNYLSYLDSSKLGQSQIIDRVVISLFRMNNDATVDKLSSFIKRKYLIKEQLKIKLALGLVDTIQNINQVIPVNELTIIKQRKEITFLQTNKIYFKVKDQVNLQVKLKNIKKLTKKIYYVNLQKSLLQGTNINENMNLNFLISSKSEELVNQAAIDPFKQIKITIPLEELKDKLGFFIVQLQGDQITSRAIIRKGAISIENKSTHLGHELSFYDEEGKRIDELVLWRNGKRFDVKKSFKIPFGSQGQQKVIAVYKNYAQSFNIQIKKEQYSFYIDYIYSSETFIKGNKAKVILHPSLKLDNQEITLSRLYNTKIKIDSINNQDIKSTQLLQNVKFKDNQDYVLQYPVKSYIKSFLITVEGEIQHLDKTKTMLNSNKNILIDLQESFSNFIDLYLQKNYDGIYLLKVRGKNGQNIENVQTKLSYEQFGVNFSFNYEAFTDQKGELQLGKLLQVTKLTIIISYKDCRSTRTWRLNNYSDRINYGGNIFNNQNLIYLKAGDNYSLPIPCDLDKQNDIIYLKYDKITGRSKNFINQLQQSKGKIQMKNLQEGKYTLILLRFDKRIDLEVIKGKTWTEDKIITEENIIYDIKKQPAALSFGDFKAEQKQNHIQISLSVSTTEESLPKNLRLHVFCKNYIDSQNPNLFTCSLKSAYVNPNKSSLVVKQSKFYSNKTLSDETAYVLNRKNMEITNGNNLEKPHIFLKRIQVRSTSEKPEQLRMEGGFDYLSRRCMNSMAPRSEMMMMGSAYGGAPNMGMYNNYSSSPLLQRKMNSHNNFLYKVGHVHENLNKIQTIKIPKGYNQVVVYLFHQNSALKQQYSIPNSKVQTIKQTHKQLKNVDEQSGWSMSRQIYPIFNGQIKHIGKNSTWTTFSLSNLVDYARIQNCNVPEWVLSWNTYSQYKKLQIYDKEYCNELNYYLSRKDKPFFQSIVKPYISNKLIKTFLDYYLLNQKQQILKYSKSHLLNKINSFQKALLTQKLKQYGMPKEAAFLANSMELPLKSQQESSQQFKYFFETVLNAKKQNSIPPNSSNYYQQQQQQNYLLGDYAQGQAKYNLFSAAPEMQMCAMQYAMQCQQMLDQCDKMQCYNENIEGQLQEAQQAKQLYKPGFKQTQKTKQYTEVSYSGIINYQKIPFLINHNKFWAQLAKHFSLAQSQSDFISDKFYALSTNLQFILACSVFPNDLQASFQLQNEQKTYRITAKSSFLIFVRQVKSLPFEKQNNIVINQRFFDPKNRFIYEDDGSSVEKEISKFQAKKTYILQTIITNISSSSKQIQLLVDIPEGSIPLKSHEQTQILNLTLQPYSTQTSERQFYFPQQGSYSFYSANACKSKKIIAKSAEIPSILVAKLNGQNKLQSLDDILREGKDQQIFAFLNQRNIFDYVIFNTNNILWKLKNKDFFNKVISIFKERQYHNKQIWSFAIYHNNFQLAKQIIQDQHTLPWLTDIKAMQLPVFQYYPYFSSRVHQFVKQNKTTIRVKQFSQSYFKFLYAGVLEQKLNESSFRLSLIYYLILQDRINEAKEINSKINAEERKQYELQYDYIDCFLDIYNGATTNYQIARKISEKYRNYPVLAWRKLFTEVYQTLTKSEQQESQGSTNSEQVSFSTAIINLGHQITLKIPSKTKVIANIYEINIQLYFSENPFAQIASFSSILPSQSIVCESKSQFRIEKIQRKSFNKLKNIFIQIYEQRQNNYLKKVYETLWNNPDIKAKINENEGTLIVYHKGKKCTTSYCKVYSNGDKGEKFYRDGYTDVASNFRYALSVDGITEFSILILTDFGGIIQRVKAPTA